MAATTFNAVQQHLLTSFHFAKTEEHLQEMKRVLCEYYAQKKEPHHVKYRDSDIDIDPSQCLPPLEYREQ